MGKHALYHFSATLQTSDLAVLHCLRALCQYRAGGPYPQIGWGGSTHAHWETTGGTFAVRFTSAARRESFVEDARRLLPGLWRELSRSDADPATPQRSGSR